jgi:predicted ATP-dependent endonuclease of OLD family
MKYTKFSIENFKGISKLELKLSDNPKSKVFTFVGLNESGKTTILEALAFLYEELRNTEEVNLNPTGISNFHSLIPKNLQYNFNENITIRVDGELSQVEMNELSLVMKKNLFEVTSIKKEVSFSVILPFSASNYQPISRKTIFSVYAMGFFGRKKTAQSWHEIPHVSTVAMDWFRKNYPPIIYYPNFLLNFPDRIYLESTENETREQGFYRKFLQDVLDAIEPGLEIQKHLLQRGRSDGHSDKLAFAHLLSKLSAKITSLVFNKNLSVFNTKIQNKSVDITGPHFDEEKLHQPSSVRNKEGKLETPEKIPAMFLEIKLRDNIEFYYIRERSLGFRWFFAFLLFTQFRISRLKGRTPVFLFDEPASNLHQTAQHRLINAIDEITKKSDAIVLYSTHSHHLINPDWLESTFIVRNKAIDYADEDQFDAKMTDIEIEKYRTFVGKYPDQTSYFQPILDVLEYRPSNLENIPDVVLVEGKNDYYTLRYFLEVLKLTKKKVNLMPGGGSGSLDKLISLYLGWGRNFVILLDNDGAAKTAEDRYLEVFGDILKDRIYKLGDFLQGEKVKSMESLFEETDISLIESEMGYAGKRSKKVINMGIQQVLIQSKSLNFSTLVREKAIKVLEGVHSALKTTK